MRDTSYIGECDEDDQFRSVTPWPGHSCCRERSPAAPSGFPATRIWSGCWSIRCSGPCSAWSWRCSQYDRPRRKAGSCVRGRHSAAGRSLLRQGAPRPRAGADLPARDSRRLAARISTKMYAFWSSVMLTTGRYKGNPVMKHLVLPKFQPELFEHWLALFDETCRELFDRWHLRGIPSQGGADRREPEARAVLSAGSAVAAGSHAMTFVVTDNCIRCKYMDCVEVCPVDCFYEGDNMLVIHPDECIDCGVCEPECPAEAIFPDTQPGLEELAQAQRAICRGLAQHHDQARGARGRQRVRWRRRQAASNISRQTRGRAIEPAT